jgi:hypothetical protein
MQAEVDALLNALATNGPTGTEWIDLALGARAWARKHGIRVPNRSVL